MINENSNSPNSTIPAEINQLDVNGWAPLHRAVMDNDLGEVKRLLKEPGIDINVTGGPRKYAPLHLAAKLGRPQIIEELLKEDKIDVTIRSKYDSTPFEIALESEIPNIEIVKECIKKFFSSNKVLELDIKPDFDDYICELLSEKSNELKNIFLEICNKQIIFDKVLTPSILSTIEHFDLKANGKMLIKEAREFLDSAGYDTTNLVPMALGHYDILLTGDNPEGLIND